jgi:hypothetical protein
MLVVSGHEKIVTEYYIRSTCLGTIDPLTDVYIIYIYTCTRFRFELMLSLFRRDETEEERKFTCVCESMCTFLNVINTVNRYKM